MEPRGTGVGARTAKTWGHRNGEIVSSQINRHSSVWDIEYLLSTHSILSLLQGLKCLNLALNRLRINYTAYLLYL